MSDKIAYLVNTKEGGNKSEFARKIGVKNPTSGLVYGWTIGKNDPCGEYQLKICEAYGVSIEWLQNDDIPVEPPIMAKETIRPTGDESALVAELRGQIEELKRDKEVLTEFVRSLQETNRTLAENVGQKSSGDLGNLVHRSKVRG